MHLEKKPVFLEKLTWQEIDEIRKKIDMIIIPIGSTEQHGPHLPLNIDILAPLEIAKGVSIEMGVPIAPPIVYGVSRTHKRFPGSLWISPETLIRMITEIGECLYFHGFKKIFIINGHGTNIWPLKCAWDNLRFKFSDIQVKVINWWELLDKEEQELLFKDGDHANIAETSIALALEQELVRREKVIDEPMLPCLFDYRIDQRSKSGISGKPSLANAEYGKEILNKAIKNAISFVKKALEEKIPYP